MPGLQWPPWLIGNPFPTSELGQCNKAVWGSAALATVVSLLPFEAKTKLNTDACNIPTTYLNYSIGLDFIKFSTTNIMKSKIVVTTFSILRNLVIQKAVTIMIRRYVPQSLCSFVAKARVKCQFQWLHFLSPNFSFFLITQQSTQWMQRKIACQNYTHKMDSIANSSRIAGASL